MEITAALLVPGAMLMFPVDERPRAAPDVDSVLPSSVVPSAISAANVAVSDDDKPADVRRAAASAKAHKPRPKDVESATAAALDELK